MPSRFIQEIPDHLLKWLQPKHQSVSNADFSSGWRPTASQLSGVSNAFSSNPVSNASKQITWKIGRTVSHGTFGTGVITNCEGQEKIYVFKFDSIEQEPSGSCSNMLT